MPHNTVGDFEQPNDSEGIPGDFKFFFPIERSETLKPMEIAAV
jgi:hypothetical protein